MKNLAPPRTHPALGASGPLHVLMVAPYVPSPIRVRPYNLLRALAKRGHSIQLVCPIRHAADALALAALRSFCTTTTVPLGRTATALAYLQAFPGSLPLQAAHCLTPTFVQAVRTAMVNGSCDVVHIEHLRAAEIARQAASGLAAPPPLILDAVDSISLLFERTIRHSPTLATRAMALLDLARTRRYEAAYSHRFSQIVTTSSEDAWAITTVRRRFAKSAGAPLNVVPNGVDLDYFRPTDAPREPATIIFSGKMSYHANEAAAFYLLREIMPLVWHTQPNARVVIAGAGSSAALLAQRNAGRIEVTGAVPDLRPYLARATVAVAPIRYGVGVQNKVLEAMAMGTPVVAARQASIALAARPGAELLVADNATDFATQITSLLNCPPRRKLLSTAGRVYVEQQHSWDTSAAILERCYAAAMIATGRTWQGLALAADNHVS